MRTEAAGFGGGKIILLGEHAVVHGTPAIAAGLQRGVVAVARPANEDVLHIEPWNRSVRVQGKPSDPLARAFSEALSSYPSRPSLRIEARVDLPPGAGLGCSAALGVAILDAIDKALGIERSREALGKQALRWERFFHGSPSGVDNTAAALGGLIRFQHGRGVSTMTTSSAFYLVVAHSGERSDTGEMVAKVARQLEAEPSQTRRLFSEVRDLVDTAEAAVVRGDAATLGHCLDRNGETLGALGLTTRRTEHLCRTARSAGALGAKVTGAGGGGCIVALGDGEQRTSAIADALRSDAFVVEVGHAA